MKSKAYTVLALMIIVTMIFGSAAAAVAKDSTGSTDISDEAVDSILIRKADGTDSSGTVYNWEDFLVIVTFSEDDADGNQKSGLDIEGGDTITINWTAPTGITFAGYSNTFYLYADSGDTQEVIATVVVTTAECTITFNDNVNGLQHVSCTMYFKINASGDLDAGDTAGSVYSGSVETSVNVEEYDYSSSTTFSHKSATYATDGTSTITWSIWLNEDYRTDLDGNIVITDTLPDTETFDSFVYYTSRDQSDNWEGIAYTLDEFNTGGRSFSISGNTITITIPASDLTAPITGLFVFTTTSTAGAGETVTNTATVNYSENSTEYTDTDSESIAAPLSNGTVTSSPLGSLEINKVISGTTDPVEGVTFRVYKVNSESDHTRISGWNDGADYAEVSTDEDGSASLADLTDGVYEIEEVTSELPEWIGIPETTSTYVTVEGTAEEVTIENSVKTGDIAAEKYWTLSDGTTPDTSDHPVIYFRLYRSVGDEDAEAVDGAEIKAVETSSGESSADVIWEDLPLYDNSGNKYTYSVKEVDSDGNDYTPTGYTKTESGLTVTNQSNLSSALASSGINANDIVQTGDAGNTGAWLLLLATSCALTAAIGYRKHRHHPR
ncbi:MAG: SpaA isopeptide-forming pilin-related protein [Anaerovoracaceae bacterium]|jgi:hypothetical protein